jgi:hypothetical protein
MTAFDTLLNYLGKNFTLWNNKGEILADGILDFSFWNSKGEILAVGILNFSKVFSIEGVAFDSNMVEKITDGNIHLS